MSNTEHLNVLLDLALARTLLVKEAERRLSSHGLGLSDLALLLELHQVKDSKITRQELAERLGVTPSGIARQLNPLERIGFVGRESVASDARMSLVVLTKAGANVVSEVLEDAEESASTALSKRWSEAEVAQLGSLLQKVRV